MSEDVQAEAVATPPTHALMIELEYAAAKIRKVEFEAIRRGIEPKGVALTPIAFSRSPMSPLHRTAVTDILLDAGKRVDAIEKAVAHVDKSVADYCQNEAEPDVGLANLIKAAQARNVSVIAFTALLEKHANVLMSRLELDEMGVHLIIPEKIKESFPQADDWLKMLKQLRMESVVLVAIVSSQVACKGALTAGATCIVIPDEFTAYQDFSGAKFVLDNLIDENPETLLNLTLRM